MGHFDKSLPPDERSGQHELSTTAYLQIAAELLADRIIVLSLQEFSALVSAAVTDQYPEFARYGPFCAVSFEKMLEFSH